MYNFLKNVLKLLYTNNHVVMPICQLWKDCLSYKILCFTPVWEKVVWVKVFWPCQFVSIIKMLIKEGINIYCRAHLMHIYIYVRNASWRWRPFVEVSPWAERICNNYFNFLYKGDPNVEERFTVMHHIKALR